LLLQAGKTVCPEKRELMCLVLSAAGDIKTTIQKFPPHSRAYLSRGGRADCTGGAASFSTLGSCCSLSAWFSVRLLVLDRLGLEAGEQVQEGV